MEIELDDHYRLADANEIVNQTILELGEAIQRGPLHAIPVLARRAEQLCAVTAHRALGGNGQFDQELRCACGKSRWARVHR